MRGVRGEKKEKNGGVALQNYSSYNIVKSSSDSWSHRTLCATFLNCNATLPPTSEQEWKFRFLIRWSLSLLFCKHSKRASWNWTCWDVLCVKDIPESVSDFNCLARSGDGFATWDPMTCARLTAPAK
jgi:hypothetical protein